MKQRHNQLRFRQHVFVVRGEHAGCSGLVMQCRTEGNGPDARDRLELATEDGTIVVYGDDIDVRYEGINIMLAFPVAKHAALKRRFREIEQGDS